MESIINIHSCGGAIDDSCAGEGFCLPGARSYILRANVSKDLYRIDVAFPENDAPENGWPFIILLDADGCFGTCVEAVRRMGRRPDATGTVPCVTIGISAHGEGDVVRRRRRDFTTSRAGEEGVGRAADFLSFIEEQVKPLAAGLGRLDPARGTLFGHSLAGFFVLWVLGRKSDAFRSYAAISPSIWWDRSGLEEMLCALRRDGRHVLLGLGEWEDEFPPWQKVAQDSSQVRARRRERKMLEGVRSVADLLGSVLGEERVQLDILAGEDHASIISAAIPRALRMASLP